MGKFIIKHINIWKNHKKYSPGAVIELTPEEVKFFGDKVEPFPPLKEIKSSETEIEIPELPIKTTPIKKK